MEQAKKMYNTIVKAIENHGWHGEFNDEELSVELRIKGDDLPMILRLHVRAEREMVVLYCTMPFKFSQEHMVDGAYALCYINDLLSDGCFDLDLETGRICFRHSILYLDSIIGPGAIEYMLDFSVYVVDEFNDKLLAINKGLLSVEDFINSQEKER